MFRFELLENGIDYLAEAVRRLSDEPDRADLKYAILHLGSGIELLLKARLVREDWRLLFPDLDQADERVFRSGKFISINTWKAIKRLEDLGVQIADADQARIELLRGKRNLLEHLSIEDTREAVMAWRSGA